MPRKPRWIQNMEAREKALSERAQIRQAIWECERGEMKNFSTLELHFGLDANRVTDLIQETLNLSRDDALFRFGKWTSAALVAELVAK